MTTVVGDPRTPAADAFVGRVPVLHATHRWLQEAGDGRFRLLIVDGPAGIGKTALAGEVRRQAEGIGFRAAAGACHEDIALPYLPVAAPLRALGPDVRAAVDALLRPDTTPDREAADRQLVARHLGVVDALLASATAEPVLLVVDDLH